MAAQCPESSSTPAPGKEVPVNPLAWQRPVGQRGGVATIRLKRPLQGQAARPHPPLRGGPVVRSPSRSFWHLAHKVEEVPRDQSAPRPPRGDLYAQVPRCRPAVPICKAQVMRPPPHMTPPAQFPIWRPLRIVRPSSPLVSSPVQQKGCAAQAIQVRMIRTVRAERCAGAPRHEKVLNLAGITIKQSLNCTNVNRLGIPTGEHHEHVEFPPRDDMQFYEQQIRGTDYF